VIVATPAGRRAILDRARRVAMVGASPNPQRPSYFVFRYLRTHGYDVRGINPNYPEIDGVACYADLSDYAKHHGPPDVVDVFRKPSEASGVVRQAIDVNAKVTAIHGAAMYSNL